MGPNALRHTKDANIRMMMGTVRSESAFSLGVRFQRSLAVTICRMPNPYLGEDHVEVMKWFLKKVCCGEPSMVDILLSAHSML